MLDLSKPPVTVGQILILQEEFRSVAAKPHQPRGLVLRAELLDRLLEEILMWRESAGRETENG